jgi:hypothetical protein
MTFTGQYSTRTMVKLSVKSKTASMSSILLPLHNASTVFSFYIPRIFDIMMAGGKKQSQLSIT